MKDQEIINLGKSIFGLCFLLGSICLFGFIITRFNEFAFGGYVLLGFGTVINVLIVFGLLIYGAINTRQLNVCLKAVGIIAINIPIAILYAIIGINLL
ncbi:hypothetical protein C1637_24430 [Chryseobacterium lactis]|uniref:Branched-chain amino acid:cation transporter, LIVCS family n=1 Tax=Chryseobacterium lactis TaxID=1241981 RepID=A0A3G6RYK1_CHRLC|nr:hypothetical protein [Chryseobacterium lactis]AZA82006.1 hypothetical protein EG342_08840 [Chryseobacterium lactis]AZB07004.1 hypothetical protein EG341_24955 [Chryseobacterium lactis]PNW11049.1 hypothetical protein C1637_24430 [Chryseobacterium lactis]